MEEPDPLVDKATRLFTFLAKVQRLKERPVRDVERYKGDGMVRWFSDLPDHPAVQWSDAETTLDAPLLVINRLDKVEPPEIPTSISTWVSGGGLHCEHRPQLLPHIVTGSHWDEDVGAIVEDRTTIEEHPKVQQTFDRWIEAWDDWAAEEKAAIPVREAYTALFGAHVEASQNPEEKELVLALGLLAWDRQDHETVRRHLFTVKVDIHVDSRTGRLEVEADPEAIGLKAELDMLDPEVFPTSDLPIITEERASEFSSHAMNRAALQELGSMTIYDLDPEGRYLDEGGTSSPNNIPTLSWSPTLILRPRPKIGLAQAFEKIAADIEDADRIPAGLRPLLDPSEAPPTQPDPSPGALLDVDQDVFSPLPLNGVQRQILERVDRHAQTLVQGPPGTGKTHTAAALLSHLLAQGKRVLVTAHTDRALYEVRGKLPELIRPLAVSVIGASRSDMAELRTAVDTISRNATEHDLEQTDRLIIDTLTRVDELRSERQRLNNLLVEVRERETLDHEHAGYRGTLASIAQQYEADRDQHSWISSLHTSTATPTEILDNSEAREWLGLLRDDRLNSLAGDVDKRAPELDALPSPEDFAALVDAKGAAENRQSAFGAVADHEARAPLAGLEPRERRQLQERLHEVVALIRETTQLRAPWVQDAISDVRLDHTQVWSDRYSQLVSLLQYVDERTQFLGHETRVDVTGDPNTNMQLAGTVRQHLQSGGQIKTNIDGSIKLGMFTSSTIKQCKPFFDNVRVNGRAPTTVDQINRYTAYRETLWALDRMDRGWPSGTLVPAEDTLFERSAWHRGQLHMLWRVLNLRQPLSEIDGYVRERGLPAIDWSDLRHVETYSSVVDAIGADEEVMAARVPLDDLEKVLSESGRWDDAADWVGPMKQAVDTCDHRGYAVARNRAEELRQASLDIRRRDALTARARAAAPTLVDAVLDEPNIPEWDSRLGRLQEACAWANTGAWVLEQEALDANDLQEQITRTEEQLQGTAEAIAAMRAWNHAVGPERLDGESRADLTQYSQLVRRLGKGTGKYAARQRAEIRDSLDRCRPSVPVWIMPLYRVVEQLRISEDMFDVVLIDEASQAGLEASFLQYLAPKIVVIGDDKQVSPAAVGVDQQALRDLGATYVYDDRYKASWIDPTRSLFDEAQMRYQGKLTLTEHRRCVPEIIGFSNRIAYEPDGIRLTPVRQFGADRLEPFKITRTPEAFEEGRSGSKINTHEARALVDALKECLEDPSYDDRTLGVISLLGTAQSKHIEKLLLDEVDADEWEQRQLRVGSPPDFQGSERDVIFLSMVSSAEPGSRLAALTREMYVQRYNVAVSRAKDQVWLFHTISTNDLTNEQDLRYQLLDYAYGVRNRGRDLEVAETPVVPEDERVVGFDSLFEQRVYNRIVDRGFTVVPQFEAQGYSIDLVIVGANGRLAVECDGDRWHGPDAYAGDLARQRDLERCGWTFYRVRESTFYIDKAAALAPLWELLDELDIRPAGHLDFDADTTEPDVKDVGDDSGPERVEERRPLPTLSTAESTDLHWIERIPESNTGAHPTPPPPPPPAQVSPTMAPAHSPNGDHPQVAYTSDAAPAGEMDDSQDGHHDQSDHDPTGGHLTSYEVFSQEVSPVGEASMESLIEGIEHIIAAEGPMTGERLLRSYVGASGGKRVGKTIAKQLNSAIARAERTGRIVSDNPLQRPGVKPRTFRLADQATVVLRTLGRRSLEEVPPGEVAAAMRLAQSEFGAVSDEDILRHTLWIFGRKSLTQAAHAHLDPVLAMIRREEIGAEEGAIDDR